MFIRNDEVLEAARIGRVPAIFDGTCLRAYASGTGYSVYGFRSASVTRCGQPLPEPLREVLEAALSSAIQHCGPPASFYVAIDGSRRICDCGAALGNWGHVRNRHGGGKAVADAVALGAITDVTWKGPSLRMLGFDDETGVVFYEYVGEGRYG